MRHLENEMHKAWLKHDQEMRDRTVIGHYSLSCGDKKFKTDCGGWIRVSMSNQNSKIFYAHFKGKGLKDWISLNNDHVTLYKDKINLCVMNLIKRNFTFNLIEPLGRGNK